MAKKSAIENNKRKAKLVKAYAGRRARLKAIANDKSLSIEEQFEARLKLAQLPRNSAQIRVRNRCDSHDLAHCQHPNDGALEAPHPWDEGPRLGDN